jgi:transcriptional regulator with XRE-family HTH domain
MPEDDAGHAGGLSSGPGAFVSAGEVICELRSGLGWSQGRLAEELGRVSGHPITREYVSRWEHGRKTPGPFWIGHLAAVLQVPRWALEGHVKRREMLRLTGAAAAAAFMGSGKLLPPDSEDLFSSVAAGDAGPLAQIQTSYSTDLAIGGLAAADRPVLWRLAQWAEDGGSDVLRVNAAGVLAKSGVPDFAGLPAAVMVRDREVRARYLRAVAARVGNDPGRLAAEALNPADSGARWCAGWMLARDGSAGSRRALTAALRNEPVTENVRTFGLLLNGENPCS